MQLRAPVMSIFGLLAIVGIATRPTHADVPSNDGVCFPACRAGFVCSHEHECVSACNPTCAAGETCAADGRCVFTAVIASGADDPTAGATTTEITTRGDVKDRRLAAPLSWSISGGIGGGQGEGGYVNSPNSPYPSRLKHEGAIVTVGFGLRKYFTRVMGAQARASGLLGFGNGSIVGILADGTLRVGPFGTGFPLFLGGGPFLGATYISKYGSGAGLMGGGVAEVGFLFGQNDRLEISLRTYVGLGDLGNGKGVTVYPAITIGYRL